MKIHVILGVAGVENMQSKDEQYIHGTSHFNPCILPGIYWGY